MCEIFDAYWQYVIGVLLALTVLFFLLRIKVASAANALDGNRPVWMVHVLFWGQGFVAITMLLLMVMGFVCAGSPGDITGIVPN